MSSPLDRVRTYFGLGRRGEGERPAPPRDTRTPLQLVIGSAFGGLVAGLLYALFGGDVGESVSFGIALGVLFLFLDLAARRKQRRQPPGG